MMRTQDTRTIGDLISNAHREVSQTGYIDGRHHTDRLSEAVAMIKDHRKEQAVELLVRVVAAAEAEQTYTRSPHPDPTGFTVLVLLLWDMGRDEDAEAVQARFSRAPLAA